MAEIIDLLGQRFTRLLVIRRDGFNKWKNAKWLCKCDCGKEVSVYSSSLRKGITMSCGCYGRDVNTTHGLRKDGKYDSEYRIWAGMKDRCYNYNNPQYKDYGGRGISVCDRWRYNFENFITDMCMKPTVKHTLDRIDNDGNYEPSNCRWATRKEQNSHTRKTRLLEHDGRKMILADWVRELKIPHATLHYKLRSKSLSEIIQSVNG